jgi:glycosyltransferase involved in cell wall biosynthesis
MKILMLSLDRTILNRDSATAKRFVEYAEYATEIHVLVPTIGGSSEVIELAPGVQVYPTASRARLWYYYDLPKRAGEILARAQSHEGWVVTTQDPFDLGFIGYRISRRFGIPLHVQDHQDCFSGMWWRSRSITNRIRYHVGKFVVRRADAIRVVSERSKRSLATLGVDESRIAVVPMHTPIAHIEETLPAFDLHDKYGTDAFIALFIGRFASEKNLPLLLQAFEHTAVTVPNIHLVLVGSGSEAEYLKRQKNESAFADRIHIEGWTDDIASYLKTADCLVLSSWYEGWGRVLIEALAARLPIVTTDVGCVREVVRHEDTALVTPVGDMEAFASALTRLIEDESLRQRFKANAQNALEGLMSREATDQAFFASIEQAVQSRR